MPGKDRRQGQARLLRTVRKIHRWTGVALFLFFFIVAVTGLLLGWKKHSGGAILARTYQGSTTDLTQWLSIDSLHRSACRILHDSVSPALSLELDRIYVRKDKGTVKFVFADHFWGLQLDGATGQLLHIERRRADLIERIHDGSIIDQYLRIDGGWFKLFYTTVTGLALLVFTITGFWLWYGPKRMRNR
ncbi:MAG: PepSY-associated TM helix domain-containing protein [Flavobacteriales bacterium]|jgi:uncharacterized iron-regulated membrane protein|nr:PepSY-associated TM helix domain-containing protein [Flavobacteriales bacterium]